MKTWVIRHTLADGSTEETGADEDGDGTLTFTAPEGATSVELRAAQEVSDTPAIMWPASVAEVRDPA